MQIELPDKTIELDAAQAEVLKELNQLKKSLEKFSGSFFKKFFSKNPQKKIKSLYIYGKVGRGKSMLMMNFFREVKIKNKIHFHFNSFMQEVHKELHRLRKDSNSENDLIKTATKNIIGKNKLLCFDEFQVEDVADAMILNRMFSFLFEEGIVVVATSNSHPLDLYKHGLQRDLFLKFVREILEKHYKIINLDGKIDYRSEYLQSLKRHYFYPKNSTNKKEILEIFTRALDGNKPVETELEFLGRKLTVKKSYKNIVLFDFKELFEADLGVPDYQAICQHFKIIFLLNIPKLTPEDRNEAKRLILFIDEAYENKVDLIILAEVKPEEIYEEGVGCEAFKRAVSRLNEITS